MEKNSSIRALIMTLSQTFVCFSSPVRLSMQISLSPRPRVVPSGDVLLLEKDDREFTELPMYLHIDPVRRYMLAYLSPIPAPLVIYGPEDFGPASSDTMEEHAERVIAICGEDPASVLQPLIDGTAEAYWDRPAPPKRIPREILNWRAKAVLARMGLTDQIDGMIQAMPEPDRTVVSAAWHGNAALARKGATVTALAAALGLSEAQVDELFLSADAINI